MAYTHTVEIELGNGFEMEGKMELGQNPSFSNENGEAMTLAQHQMVQSFFDCLNRLHQQTGGIVKVEVNPIT